MKNLLSFIIGFGLCSILCLSFIASQKEQAYNIGYIDGESQAYNQVDTTFFRILEENGGKWSDTEYSDIANEVLYLVGRDWLGE